MLEQQQSLIAPVEQGKWKNWLIGIMAVLIVLLFLGKSDPNSIRELGKIVGIIALAVLAVLFFSWYMRQRKFEDITKMIKKSSEELAKLGHVVNKRVENVEIVPLGQNLFYLYFKSNALGVFRDPNVGNIGLSSRTPIEVRSDYENSRINELLREGKIVLQKPLEAE